MCFLCGGTIRCYPLNTDLILLPETEEKIDDWLLYIAYDKVTEKAKSKDLLVSSSHAPSQAASTLPSIRQFMFGNIRWVMFLYNQLEQQSKH